MVSAKNILNPDLGPIGSLDSPVIKQIAQLSNPYSGVFSISRPTVHACDHDYFARQQIPLLEGREKCDIKLDKIHKFRLIFKITLPNY